MSAQQHIIKLKESLVAKGYSEIDQDEEFHINYFETKSEVLEFINAFIAKENLSDSISTEEDTRH
ncbi:hypothetical protein SAMN05444387_4597 [Flavobacterium pectinovorum]|uniref:Uncharacterized protein n=1 Tax=Flavobacterium pectinovorum TaxID=29533 RepID=A0AB36NX99_9FLAO|nr:hypothetical protein B0A72_18910 [Flavobacterium pectinovorum]SHN19482.1 hypothetical protein SAMN05444387_4597 [Flavobacterium pectinovorum]